MELVKKVSDVLSIAGQLAPEHLQQAAGAGFKSVLNLRSPDEITSLPDERQHAQAAGLEYVNIPLKSALPDGVSVNQALEALERLPKPVLVHCGAGQRAGAIALIATARTQQWSREQLIENVQAIGLSLDQPHLSQFVQQHYKDPSGLSTADV